MNKTKTPAAVLALVALFGSAGYVGYTQHKADPIAMEITGPDSCPVGALVELQAKGVSKNIAWYATGGQSFKEYPSEQAIVPSTQVGGVTEYILAGSYKGKVRIVSHTLQVGDVVPVPPGPIPQPFPPGPTPPGPTPVITTGPVRVLIVEESQDSKQSAYPLLNSVTLRQWLQKHGAAQAPTDKFSWVQVWDQNAEFAPSATGPQIDFWKSALKLPHDSLPWIYIWDANGKPLDSKPLPKTEADVISLVKKYSGE